MALVIIADDRVFEEEVSEFVNAVTALQNSVEFQTPVESQNLRDWFNSHEHELNSLMQSPRADAEIAKLFVRLNTMSDKKNMLKGMLSVAVSDGEIHLNEKILMSMAALYWNLDVHNLVSS